MKNNAFDIQLLIQRPINACSKKVSKNVHKSNESRICFYDSGCDSKFSGCGLRLNRSCGIGSAAGRALKAMAKSGQRSVKRRTPSAQQSAPKYQHRNISK